MRPNCRMHIGLKALAWCYTHRVAVLSVDSPMYACRKAPPMQPALLGCDGGQQGARWRRAYL